MYTVYRNNRSHCFDIESSEDIESEVKKNTVTEVGNIIESFGLNAYSRVTGISRDFFSYVFR